MLARRSLGDVDERHLSPRERHRHDDVNHESALLEVRLQFLTEAVVLCALGGLVGIALGFGASIGLAALIEVPFGFDPMINIARS